MFSLILFIPFVLITPCFGQNLLEVKEGEKLYYYGLDKDLTHDEAELLCSNVHEGGEKCNLAQFKANENGRILKKILETIYGYDFQSELVYLGAFWTTPSTCYWGSKNDSGQLIEAPIKHFQKRKTSMANKMCVLVQYNIIEDKVNWYSSECDRKARYLCQYFERNWNLGHQLNKRKKIDLKMQQQQTNNPIFSEPVDVDTETTVAITVDVVDWALVGILIASSLGFAFFVFVVVKIVLRFSHQRWFTIKDNKLFYQKRKDDMTVAVDEVPLCNVRATDDGERRFCFEVISPEKSFLLQGDSEEVREQQNIADLLLAHLVIFTRPVVMRLPDIFRVWRCWYNYLTSSGSRRTAPEERYKCETSSIGAAYKNTSIPSTSEPLQQVPATVVNKSLTSVAISRASSNSSLLNHEGQTEKEDGGVQGAKSTNSFLEEGHHSIIATLNQVPGNRMCADCKRSDPRWASISLGATLCIDCCGVHRSLGVHVSKVRSLTLDQWEPEVVKIMVGLGNTRLNEIYEANLPAEDKIKANCSNKDRQVFIKAKYVDRKYVMTLPTTPTTSACGSQGQKLNRWTVSKRRTKKKRSSDIKTDGVGGDVTEVDTELEETVNDVLIFGGVVNDNKLQDFDDKDIYDVSQLTPDLLFYKAAEAANLPVMMLAACNGASPNCSNDKDGGKAPLMASAAVGSIQVCEYLLLNGAKINAKDDLGRTALHYVSLHNRTGVACQLLKRRVDLDAVDSSGKTALEIAIEDANADIVTLIRLKKMSNQMKEDDALSFQQSDDLVNDVFRDFTRRAASGPHSPQPTDSTFNILSAPSWNNNSTPSNASPADGTDTNKENKQSGTSDQSSITLADVTLECEPVESYV